MMLRFSDNSLFTGSYEEASYYGKLFKAQCDPTYETSLRDMLSLLPSSEKKRIFHHQKGVEHA